MQQDPIVVFSLGKTGTTTVAEALQAATGRTVVKAHALSRTGLDIRYEKAERLGVAERPRHLWRCEEIANILRSGGSWDLICGIRDPVAAAVSDHFYGLQLQVAANQTPWIDDGDTAAHARAIERTLETMWCDVDWFETELQAITDIDVYAKPFDVDRGFGVYEQDRFRAIVIRAEDLSLAGPQALADYVGLDKPLEMKSRNVGSRRDVGSDYQRFCVNPGFDPLVLDRVYRTPLARHFYSDAERAQFVKRWNTIVI